MSLKNNPLFPNTVSYSVILFVLDVAGTHTMLVCLFQLCTHMCFSHWLAISLASSTVVFKDPQPSFIQSCCLFLTDFCLLSTLCCCSSVPLKTKLLLAKQTPVCLLSHSQNAAHVAACLISLPVVHIHCCWAATDCRVTKMRDRESMHLLVPRANSPYLL